jgi:transposase
LKRVDTIARVRRAFYVQGWSVKKIVRELHVSRNTVRKILRTDETDFSYERERQPMPRIGPWQGQLEQFLSSNANKPSLERLTLIRIFEELRGLGYEGGYDAVRRFAKGWSQNRGAVTAEAYAPLYYAPGEAYQFDWSHEVVVISGVTVTVKVAHVRLCRSRMMFARVYIRESQEMVFDAHDRAFAFFKGTCTRGTYDNMKTAVEAVFTGKERHYNRRFLQMCSHYLVQPVACTPASGWERGQVENQIGLVRERFFTPWLRVKSLDELNAWLLDKCVAYAKAHRLPKRPTRRSGRCSRPSARISFPMSAVSTASTACRLPCRRPARCGSTTTSIPSWPRPSDVRSKCMPMPNGSSSGRMAWWLASMPAQSGGARQSMTRGTMCLFWRVNPARCAMVPRSRTGCFRPPWPRSDASSRAAMMATGRWSIS